MTSMKTVTSCESYEWYKPSAKELCIALPVFAARYEDRLQSGSKLYANQNEENYYGGIRDYLDNETNQICEKLRILGEEFHRAKKTEDRFFTADTISYGENFANLFTTLDHFIDLEERLASEKIKSPLSNAAEIVAKKIQESLDFIEAYLSPVKDDQDALHTLRVGIGSLVDNPGRAVKHYKDTLARMKSTLSDTLPKIMTALPNDPQESKGYCDLHYQMARAHIRDA